MIGSTISHYQILEKLGEGGMGVVYKAHDTNLDRFVALKFFPPHLSASEADKARFVQEAKAASALNHPNVCTIHDIQENDGQLFIVMEFVDGQTLGEKRGALSYKQAIDIGIQIAEGLAAAHERGVVHRDIKPDNIMLRKDGIVQIMDFGLAKLRGASRLTKEGSTVGTAGYMSPEQVQGLDADHRSDIFSMGVVLFELLTHQLPFKGIHETAIAYEIVNVDSPPMSSISADVAPELDAIVLECLEKDPKERTQAASQVALDLKRYRRDSSRQRMSRITAARPAASSHIRAGTQTQPPMNSDGERARQRYVRWMPMAAVALVALLLGLGVASILFRPANPPEPVWASIEMPRGTVYVNGVGGHSSISPDGSAIVFSGIDSLFQRTLWVRPLRSNAARSIPGTKDAEYPFWSFDSRSIGFFAEGKLRTVSASGGPVLTLADAPLGRGGTWGKNGLIVFAPNVADPNLFAVPSVGGAVRQVTARDTGTNAAPRFPSFLPDGHHFLFTSVELNGRGSSTTTYVGSDNGEQPKEIARGLSNCVYAGGHLLYLRQGILMAQPFNTSSFSLTGDAVALQEGVNAWLPRAKGDFSVSDNGILLSSLGGSATKEEIVWIDGEGRQQAIVQATPWTAAQLSPDEKRIVFDEIQNQDQRTDIWVFDIARSVKTRLTFGSFSGARPLWSRDGSKIFYSAEIGPNKANLLEKRADGSGQEVLLVQGTNVNSRIAPLDVSPDNRSLLVTEISGNQGELGIIDLNDSQRPARITKLNISGEDAKFSPDGKWIVYQSDESGKREIYVRSFRGEAGQWQISSGSGEVPVWFDTGIVFYSSSIDAHMKAEVSFSAGRPSFGQAKPLFPPSTSRIRQVFGRSKTGGRFLAIRPLASRSSSSLSVILNWPQLLTK
jgi:eukaryotic-like serine/threonine-protein kinase